MWTVLLVSIAVTVILSLVNWFYKKSRDDNNERNEVILDIHWRFLFGLLMSKGMPIIFLLNFIGTIIIHAFFLPVAGKLVIVLQAHLRCDLLEEPGASLL